ncbi:YchJ family metal-binding protein, partial [Verrucomicrobiota bacterium]
PGDVVGHVEFVAEYTAGSGPGRHHERSFFKKLKGKWYYLSEA